MVLVSLRSLPGAPWRGVRLLVAPGVSRGEMSLARHLFDGIMARTARQSAAWHMAR